jgi:hypothetical protein
VTEALSGALARIRTAGNALLKRGSLTYGGRNAPCVDRCPGNLVSALFHVERGSKRLIHSRRKNAVAPRGGAGNLS